MLSIKKIFCSLIFILISHTSIFSNNFVTQFGLCGNTPVLSELEYEKHDYGITVKTKEYVLSADVDVDNKYVFEFSAVNSKTIKYRSKIRNQSIYSIFEFTLEKNRPCVLICYNVNEATGLGANITYGLLIEFINDTFTILELSTFGDITENFVDINNDGIFEFICIDLEYNQGNTYLIPNVFLLNSEIKNITDKTKSFSICLDSDDLKRLDQLDYTLLENPDILEKY